MTGKKAFAPTRMLFALVLGLGLFLPGGGDAQTAGQAGVRSDGAGTQARHARALLEQAAPLLPARAERPPRARPPQVGERELTCLAQALYHEARGEGRAGQLAVAEVVLNRVESPRFPDTICGVVRQGASNGRGCQFSFVCNGAMNGRLEPAAWRRAQALAREMVRGAPRVLTEGATHFHALHVRPSWARVYRLTAEIGAHRFYRRAAQVASN
jgi:spore germination cell wall hydrolase CwlJ-like protein